MYGLKKGLILETGYSDKPETEERKAKIFERVTDRWTGKTDNRRRVHLEQDGRDGSRKGLSKTGEELDSNC
jgi:hypothetical protein